MRSSALTAPKGCISLVGIDRTRFPRISRYKPLPSPAAAPSWQRDEHRTPDWDRYFCEADARKFRLVGIAHCTPDAPTCPLRSTGVVEVLVHPSFWRATPPLYSEKIARVPLGENGTGVQASPDPSNLTSPRHALRHPSHPIKSPTRRAFPIVRFHPPSISMSLFSRMPT